MPKYIQRYARLAILEHEIEAADSDAAEALAHQLECDGKLGLDSVEVVLHREQGCYDLTDAWFAKPGSRLVAIEDYSEIWELGPQYPDDDIESDTPWVDALRNNLVMDEVKYLKRPADEWSIQQ